MKPLPAISLWQPWASYVGENLKLNETRHWPTKFRGTLAIHAAKTVKAVPSVPDHLRDAGRTDLLDRFPKRFKDWPLGCVVAVVEMIDCVPTESVEAKLTMLEHAMGDYAAGRFAWIFKNVRKLDPPILCKGQQGFWKLNDDVAAAVWKVLEGGVVVSA